MAKYSLSVLNKVVGSGLPVRISISFAGLRLRYNTGVYVSDKKHFVRGQVTQSEPNYRLRNMRLNKITSALDLFFLETHTVNEVRSLMQNLLKGSEPDRKTLLAVFDEFISTKTKSGTIALYESTKKKIIAYDKNATLDSVDRKWLSGIESMMSEAGMSKNGYAIHLRNIRAVFNYALDEEYTTNYPFRKFKIKFEQTEKRNLTLEQLRLIRDYKCENFQEIHRDMFMLMFYLIGINAVDLLTLPRNAINEQGRIVYHRAKTGRIYSIKVEPEALAIINRYKGKKYLLSPLDTYGNYKNYLHHMNDALKTIGKTWKLGIGWRGKAICPNLSSYWSRHTWATLAFNIGIPKDVVSLALGHSFGLSVTDTYIDYSNAQVDEANRKVLDHVLDNDA